MTYPRGLLVQPPLSPVRLPAADKLVLSWMTNNPSYLIRANVAPTQMKFCGVWMQVRAAV